jgi:hypothetical protein
VLTTAPKPAAPAKSGLGPVVLIVAAVAGGGLLLCGGGVAAVVMYFLLSDSGAPAAPEMAAAPVPVAPVIVPAAVQPIEPVPPAPAPAPASNINWVAYEDNAKGFKAVFPGRKPQPLDPLVEIKDPDQRELVSAMMQDWTVLGVTHAGRKYTLTAAPLELGGVPASVYLDRMSAGLSAIHGGFDLEAQPPADSSAPLRDYVLKKNDAGKLLRVVATGGHVYQLLIEGEAGLAFSDPAAKEFFEKFEAGGVSLAAVATEEPTVGKTKSKTKSKTKRRPTESSAEATPADEPDGIDWQPLTGKKYAFTINFPGVTPEEEAPLTAVPEASRAKLEKSWTDAGITVESYAAQAGDRRYAVAVFHNSQVPSARSNPAGQLDSLTRMYTMEIYDKSRGRGFPTPEPKAKWQQWTTTSQSIKDNRKVVVRRAVLLPYAFVARVEGPATMQEMDPQVHKFFDSLMPPPDAVGLGQ